MKKISGAKVAVDVLLLAALVTSCGVMIKGASEPKAAEEVDAGAAVMTAAIEDKRFGSPKPVEYEYAVPVGDTSFKSYMDWECITNTNSTQYKLQQDCWTDDTGLRRYGDDYVVALGSYYAKYIGERFRVTLSTGEDFPAVVGDFKADCHTDSLNRYTPMGDGGKNVVEFVVDTQELDDTVRKMGDISYIEGFEGNVERIEKVYESEDRTEKDVAR
jgi:hypothetical protein